MARTPKGTAPPARSQAASAMPIGQVFRCRASQEHQRCGFPRQQRRSCEHTISGVSTREIASDRPEYEGTRHNLCRVVRQRDQKAGPAHQGQGKPAREGEASHHPRGTACDGRHPGQVDQHQRARHLGGTAEGHNPGEQRIADPLQSPHRPIQRYPVGRVGDGEWRRGNTVEELPIVSVRTIPNDYRRRQLCGVDEPVAGNNEHGGIEAMRHRCRKQQCRVRGDHSDDKQRSAAYGLVHARSDAPLNTPAPCFIPAPLSRFARWHSIAPFPRYRRPGRLVCPAGCLSPHLADAFVDHARSILLRRPGASAAGERLIMRGACATTRACRRAPCPNRTAARSRPPRATA